MVGKYIKKRTHGKKLKKYSFKKFDENEIKKFKEAYLYQKIHSDWTFYNERELLTNTLVNRFNYLLLMFSLFTAVFFKQIILKTNSSY